MRVLPGVLLHGLGRAAVGVALAEDRVDGGTHDLRVAGPGVLLGLRLRGFGEVGDLAAVGLQFGDGFLQLQLISQLIMQVDR